MSGHNFKGYIGKENLRSKVEKSMGRLTVKAEKDVIVVRVEGEPSETLLRECHDKVLNLVQHSNLRKILYNKSGTVLKGTG